MDFSALWLAGEAARIPLSMLLVFGTAKILAEICERISVPGIVGEILAGVLLGPAVLAWISPNELLSALADLGVMFLLFRVGLEVKASELLRLSGVAALVAVAGVVAPFLCGWLIMLGWGYAHAEAIFVGAAMVATSVGITAQVLAAKGLLDLRSSRIILAAAVIDDVLGLLVLAVVGGAARGRPNFLDIALVALLSVTFVLVVARWGARAMNKVVPRAQEKLRVAEGEFALALVLLFALSLLAVYAGVAAIVGAFLAGMALGESVGTRVKDLASGASETLAPFFLAGIGLRVELAGFREPGLMALAGVILLAAIGSKFLGCGLGALSLGRLEAARIGLGMVPRGEVGMVVAQLGLVMGTISRPVYGVVVFMAVATTIVTPPLLNLAYRGVARESPTDDFRLG
jgi:Kef-type K+ transport system membrane component KefB